MNTNLTAEEISDLDSHLKRAIETALDLERAVFANKQAQNNLSQYMWYLQHEREAKLNKLVAKEKP